MDRNLISVIVPIYNVEIYLDRCIESIVNQTYKNLEIILVNDGSTDNSLTICQKWAKKDNRIKVIDKENGGLSSARNAGLDIANGEYVSFVDSDDYIDKNIYDEMIKNIIITKSDIISCSIQEIQNNGNKINTLNKKDTILNSEECIKDLLFNHKRITPYAWDKLYKKDIIGSSRFIEKLKFGEDAPFAYDLLKKIKKYQTIDFIGYYYIRRDNSLIGNKFKKHQMFAIKAADIILEDCIKNNRYVEFAKKHKLDEVYALINGIIKSDEEHLDELNTLLSILNSYTSLFILKHYKFTTALKILFIKYNFTLYKKMYLKVKKG